MTKELSLCGVTGNTAGIENVRTIWPRSTAKVVSPKTIRRPSRKWWRNCEARVSRREAVETVNDMVVGEGHKVVR